MNDKYYIINKKALQSIYEKVVYVKKLLYTGKCKTVNEAAKAAAYLAARFISTRTMFRSMLKKATDIFCLLI